MKISTSAIVLAALSTVRAAGLENVTLNVEATDSRIAGQGLNAIHFGAGINGIILDSSAPKYTYDPASKRVSQEVNIASGTSYYNFTELSGDLVASVTGGSFATVENDYLTINGSNSVFYACSKLPYDPYNYVTDGKFGVAIYASDAPSDCFPIQIKLLHDSKVTSSSQPGGSATSVTSSTVGYANSTTVETTKWVTIPCPTPTTVTYGSSTYTVTQATTLTVQDCGCSNTPSVAGPSNTPTNPAGPAVVNVASAKSLSAAAVGAAIALCFL